MSRCQIFSTKIHACRLLCMRCSLTSMSILTVHTELSLVCFNGFMKSNWVLDNTVAIHQLRKKDAFIYDKINCTNVNSRIYNSLFFQHLCWQYDCCHQSYIHLRVPGRENDIIKFWHPFQHWFVGVLCWNLFPSLLKFCLGEMEKLLVVIAHTYAVFGCFAGQPIYIGVQFGWLLSSTIYFLIRFLRSQAEISSSTSSLKIYNNCKIQG